jgi:hypothetical protein
VDFEKQGVIEQGVGGADGGVKALKMPDLSDALMPGGEAHQFLCLGQRGGDGLFHQDIDASLDQRARDLEMVSRRDCNRRRLNFAIGEELLQGAESAGVELARHGVGAGCVGIYYRREVDRLALLFQFVIHAGVVPSERACANYSYIDTRR